MSVVVSFDTVSTKQANAICPVNTMYLVSSFDPVPTKGLTTLEISHIFTY